MPARTIPDGAGITNHFTCSFAPWVLEANATGISGIKDEYEIIDGPDNRGYLTGRASRQDLTVEIPSHDPANAYMHAWKDACENGAAGAMVTGIITVMTAADVPVEIWELQYSAVKGVDAPDLKLDGPEVAINKWSITYSRAKRIGP